MSILELMILKSIIIRMTLKRLRWSKFDLYICGRLLMLITRFIKLNFDGLNEIFN